jgi:predicted regulator of Ras-like GTPase activity (Roadblock/LC7/MglB family)
MSFKILIEDALRELKNIGGIEASAVVTRDGLLVASDISSSVDAETFAAMSASMGGAAETAMSEVKGGDPTRVIVEGGRLKMVSVGAGPAALLVVLADNVVPLGLVLLKMGDTARKISGLVELVR